MIDPGNGSLDWPVEAARLPGKDEPAFSHPGTNLCLDFHGDPLRARLAVFSDGNHHMALEECAAGFLAHNPEVEDVFYATTPPGPLLAALETGTLHIGNLALSIKPHVFIGPEDVLDRLVAAKAMGSHRAFAESMGNVLLVTKANPKGICGIADLMRGDVTIAISNPKTEKASFRVYAETLTALAGDAGLDVQALEARLSSNHDGVVYSAAVHHREVPQILFSGAADVAMVYYHLALRYVRVFPDLFDFVPLGGTREDPKPAPGQLITRYHIGLIGDGGDWGPGFADYMSGDGAAVIYKKHGLRRPE